MKQLGYERGLIAKEIYEGRMNVKFKEQKDCLNQCADLVVTS